MKVYVLGFYDEDGLVKAKATLDKNKIPNLIRSYPYIMKDELKRFNEIDLDEIIIHPLSDAWGRIAFIYYRIRIRKSYEKVNNYIVT